MLELGALLWVTACVGATMRPRWMLGRLWCLEWLAAAVLRVSGVREE
jgi:hypothetical protein